LRPIHLIDQKPLHILPQVSNTPGERAPTPRLVSLVMPAWRPRRDWLLRAVMSGLGQRACDLEVIVVDDGSPEPVEGLLSDIGDPRLRVIRVSHGGPSRARNAGVREARGDRIRFIDADDVYEPDSTARLLRLMGEDKDIVAYGATVFCDRELRPIWKMTSSLEGSIAIDALLGRFTVRPQSLLFSRHLVEVAGGWDDSFGVSEDWDFVVRALEHGRARGEHAVATYYRKHASSLTDDRAAGRDAARLIVERYFLRHPEQRGTSLERQAHARLEATAARIDAVQGRLLHAARGMVRSLSLDPGAVTAELVQALPALRGHLRRAVSRLTADRAGASEA
jgi:glycosyltransferase involved in cell wall biosynthesis